MPAGTSDAAVGLSRVAVSTTGGAPIHEKITTPKPPGSPGSGTAIDAATPVKYDAEYLCPVLIGWQTLNLNFDTGSSCRSKPF